MTVAASTPPAFLPARGWLARLALAALAGAALDFAYASTRAMIWGRGFAKVWQGVAAGWIGERAREGGWPTVALGLVTHCGIAFCMVGVYAAAASRAPILYRRWYAIAPLYGLILYGVMYRIVLPLRWPGAGGWKGASSVMDVCAHVGLALLGAFVLARTSARWRAA